MRPSAVTEILTVKKFEWMKNYDWQLFDWTMGHPGAVNGLLNVMCIERKPPSGMIVNHFPNIKPQKRTQLRDGGTLTIDDLLHATQAGSGFLLFHTSHEDCPLSMTYRTTDIAALFRKLLTYGSIKAENDHSEIYCHRNGWIFSGLDSGIKFYTFPSPLHAMYVSWRLSPHRTMSIRNRPGT